MTFTPHPWQLAAAEAYQRLGGVFIGLDPGAGKTYAFARIAATCRRPLVLAPAAAIAQTRKQFEAYGVTTYLAKDYDGTDDPPDAGFASYTWLTRADQHDFFERFAPTDVLMDEYHEARGLGNSARRRLERYLVANPAVRVGVATGSPYAGGPIHDLAFGLTWTLRSRAPVPVLRAGVDALDARLAASEDARVEFRRRLEAADGVFLDAGDAGRYQGEVVLRVLRRDPAEVLPDTWETPSGHLIESAAHAAEVEKMLAWGYYPDRAPRPSAAYVEARRAWGAVVRRAIAQGLADTEYQVRALRPAEYGEWLKAQRMAEEGGETTAVWMVTSGPSSVEHVLTRALYEPLQPRMSGVRASLVWAHHRALQDRAAEVLGCPLFREGARSADGAYLPDYRGQVAVASVEACHQSLNLQHFSHNLVLEPPSDPEVWKQLIGRTVRQGQLSPLVTVDIVVNCPAAERALRTAVDRARLVYQTTGKSNHLLQRKGMVIHV